MRLKGEDVCFHQKEPARVFLLDPFNWETDRRDFFFYLI